MSDINVQGSSHDLSRFILDSCFGKILSWEAGLSYIEIARCRK